MTGRYRPLGLLAGSFLLAALTSANAQAIRFISTLGSDANPCTLALPCRTLQFGIGATPIGGELRILDSGVYGATGTIVKSITIDGNGSTVIMNGGSLNAAITINNGSAVVTLRDMILNGKGTVSGGVDVRSAAAVHIEECEIEDFTDFGILAFGAVAEIFINETALHQSGSGLGIGDGVERLSVSRSSFYDNANSGIVLNSEGESSFVAAIVSGNGSIGVRVNMGRATFLRTIVTMNVGDGYRVLGGEASLEESVVRGNAAVGLNVAMAGTARLSNSTITDNTIGISGSGHIETRENNTVAGNSTADVSGATTLVPIGGT